MDYLTLPEFLHITKISDSDLLAMLEHGELEVATGNAGELLINVTNITPEKIAQRNSFRESPLTEGERAYLEEKVASQILSSLDGMLEEALALALSWQQVEKK